MRHLKANSHYVWFTLIISLILIIVFYRFTHKLGMSITKLQQFAMKADRNEPIDTDMQDTFPKNELGEISQHIIQIYKRLHQAKEDLYIEREKTDHPSPDLARRLRRIQPPQKKRFW